MILGDKPMKPEPKPQSRKKPLIVLAVTLAVLEAGAFVLFQMNWRGLETTRRLMKGDIADGPGFQNCIAQPYLLYIPAPGYKNKDGLQHNAHGYRGTLIDREKKPGVLRILFLGGSTTYGWGVPKPEQAFPAALKQMLEKEMPRGVTGIEIINAGIPSGTTAEMLTHYQFKFHYYRPDIAILNPGGNDARSLFSTHYHPDYSDSRKQIQLPEPLPPLGRFFLNSRLASLMIAFFLHGPYPNAGPFYSYNKLPPAAPWFISSNGKTQDATPTEEIAYKHNLETLLDVLKRDRVKVLLVPFRGSPYVPYWPQAGLEVEEKILTQLAAERNLTMAPFPASVISPENWVDDCHLNEQGEQQKATHLLPFVKKLITGA